MSHFIGIILWDATPNDDDLIFFYIFFNII